MLIKNAVIRKLRAGSGGVFFVVKCSLGERREAADVTHRLSCVSLPCFHLHPGGANEH